jgi:hypothetical protein
MNDDDREAREPRPSSIPFEPDDDLDDAGTDTTGLSKLHAGVNFLARPEQRLLKVYVGTTGGVA